MDVALISRQRYLDQVADFIGKDLIKVLVGQRRVGKSFILRQIRDHLVRDRGVKESEILFINKEDVAWDHVRTYQELHAVAEPYKYIFVDEIQDIEGWEKALRSLQARGGVDIYITGSNSKLLSGEFATYLSGRYVSFTVHPLTYPEFLEFHALERSPAAFDRYVRFGGLPYLRNLPPRDEAVLTYLRDVVDTVVLKDVVARHKLRNVDFLKRLLTYLARETGSIFSAKSISDYLKNQSVRISPSVVLDYLAFCQDANLIRQVGRYDIRGKRAFELKHKFFFTDVGVKNALLGGYATADVSGILENVVHMNLSARGWEVSTGEIDGKEVDFVCVRGAERRYVQVAYLLASPETRDREFASLSAIRDQYPKRVVTMDLGACGDVDGVAWTTVEEFLFSL